MNGAFSREEEVGGVRGSCRGWRPDLFNKSAENSSLDFTCNPRDHGAHAMSWGRCGGDVAILGKPLLTSTLLTSTFVFRSGGFPCRGFELEWSLVATSLEGFSVTSHEKRVPGAPFKGIKREKRGTPGTKNQSGHVKSGL